MSADPEYAADTFDGSTPSLAEVCELAARQAISDFFAVVPGVVVDYDAAAGTATIKPAVQQVGGDGVPYVLPPIPGVRVLCLGTAGADIVLEVAPDDAGLLLVSSLCMDQWVEGGDASAKPTSTRRGNLADAVFLPTRITKPQAHTPGPTTRLLIDATGNVTLTCGLIKLGSASASKAVALAPDLASHLTALETYINAHVHTCAAPASPSSPPVTPSPTPPNIAATKVKAE